MLMKAFQIAFDGLLDVFRCFTARSALGNTAGQSRASGNKNPVLVLFQINAVLHHPAFYQRRGLPGTFCEVMSYSSYDRREHDRAREHR